MKATRTVCSMLIASLIGGAASNLLLMNRVEAQAPAEAVTTSQLNLVGDGGRLRAVLSARDERGLASLAFYDDAGQVRGVFGIQPDGTPTMRMFTATGQSRLFAALQGDDALVVVGDENGRQGLLGALGGTPMLSFGDSGRTRIQMQIGDSGAPQLALFTSAGQRGATLAVGSDDAPLLTLYDAGRPRAAFGVVQQSTVLNLSDATRPRLVFGVAENGRPSVNFFDENGEVIHELP